MSNTLSTDMSDLYADLLAERGVSLSVLFDTLGGQIDITGTAVRSGTEGNIPAHWVRFGFRQSDLPQAIQKNDLIIWNSQQFRIKSVYTTDYGWQMALAEEPRQ